MRTALLSVIGFISIDIFVILAVRTALLVIVGFIHIFICFIFTVRTALLAIIGFMPTHGNGAIGSLDYSPDERKALAKK